ncbi:MULTISPECIES: UDP-glucose dehydrogenase family protein [unclassified Legionella]|uniref:UDP-glucose dehydrogenase family protein n=1 Tax=unclassified Legionella TaxID=2622702 RepID=UPI001E4CEF15|nr:UDP-glucose/GDP-mannose dehydrogenase family protein [Legionella sp. 31fI33]MCC5014395.1 UDP-glucose/GDP-mannose dehydrogenase family protein [Legionella sp. 31fI33]
MIISVYGAGYVGLVSAACLAKIGHQVLCVDIHTQRIRDLQEGRCPLYEEQLPELIQEQLRNGCLQFTTSLTQAIQQSSLHLIATGTPELPDKSADLSQVFSVIDSFINEICSDATLIIKSTVPVGTGDRIQQRISDGLLRRHASYRVQVVSNPEFLREGCAVNDFLYADRIVVGGERSALIPLQEMYKPLTDQGIPLLCMSRRSAELTKYAANAMLACRISFINQISSIAEKMGAHIDDIQQGIGLDHRIGPHFLQAGIGYGGSCFPKDTRALLHTAKAIQAETSLLEAIEAINQVQKKWAIDILSRHFDQGLENKTIGIWGLAFKPGTDDMREASSLELIRALLEAGATVRVYDPAAMDAAKILFTAESAIVWCDDADSVLNPNLDALVIATEWPVFKQIPLKVLAQALRNAPLIDGRNCLDWYQVQEAQFAWYYSVGRPVLRNGNVYETHH